ncbi:hypothetical protein HYC85_014040 [Camellia sinensis]|uniref:Diphosphomevalonate decarboxylase n=1 Tax=Camellia sinensis TaxID=4442 RepID=A0A7J7H543_CAMSI|nr:hypothetical protein HYC85_014040 [Camellia sinensis]
MGDEESKKWVLMVTAQAPTNMSVIKYWGKRDETLILPINDSISVTLDPQHLSTITTVSVSPTFLQDRLWLNGKEIRSCAGDVEDEKKGIKITKKDWENLHLHIASYNNFPTAAGLASSASGFACLVFALAKLMNLKEDNGKLSAIARQGSGSACRSLYGGFVKWFMGKNDDGRDSFAVQLADEKHWDDLLIVIPVVSSRQKETSSTRGMRESIETSTLIQYRAKVAYTCDAGPNVVLFARNRKVAALLLQRLFFHFPPHPDTDLKSYVLGDTSILQDVGIQDMKDVEALSPPPETKDDIAQKYKGDVSYFICTRPGKGPVLLSDEGQALLNPETGLP